jgi:hypothetical protein
MLERLSEVPDRDGEWVTDTARLFGPGSSRPAHYIDLGIAHGIPGVVALCTTVVCRLGDARAADLASAAAKRLLAHEFPLERRSRFPAVVEPDETPAPAQLAWCYGDAGVAVTLARAALALSDPSLRAAAIRSAKSAAARPFETSGVTELGLCHGTAGAAQTMGRLAALDDSAEPAARAWAVRLLNETEAGGLPEDPGFLTGQAGVALALLAAAGDEEPGWDRVLLLS